ncbi:MAG: recombinase RecA [Mycoplasmataceae bacterium]|nr:recombinase RecA [Mycoplasmataceae bacterium]
MEPTIQVIEKRFGKESIMILGNVDKTKVSTFSSGSISLDYILGINGFPKGRIIEIFGPESSGKTTIALHAISEIQKNGGIAAFIDVEHSIDPVYAKNLGVDIDKLVLSQPNSGEEALEIVDILAKSGCIDLIIVDSVAALVTEAELQGDMKDQTIGSQARLMSKALRKITSNLYKNKTTIIFINQIREKVGLVFGNNETTSGGRALKFYSSIRIDVRRISSISVNDSIIGNIIKMKVVKNKLAAPFKSATTEIIFSKGISRISEIIDLAEQHNIFQKKGSWYFYKDKNIAQGKNNLKVLLESSKQIYDEINLEIKQILELQ